MLTLPFSGLYKIGTGEDITKAENPGTFDLKVFLSSIISVYQFFRGDWSWSRVVNEQGKAKKKAWQKLVDEGLTQEQAQEKYVTLVESLKEKYGYDASKEPEAVGSSA
jgi:diazepam-binding inhibitor (GABA receptor modulating acyl-CoA-binding protein)